MNGPYGSQPYYPQGYYQATPGPPQPQWQARAPSSHNASWHDPRLQALAPGGSNASAASYNPNVYGPVSGMTHSPVTPPQPTSTVPSQHTASWGVRYNQSYQYAQPAQQQEPKPSLPPRPPSGAGPSPSPALPPRTSSPMTRQSQTPLDASASLAEPPPPPPRPPEYQNQSLLGQQPAYPHYSPQPLSHHYEPGAYEVQRDRLNYHNPQQPSTVVPSSSHLHSEYQLVSPEDSVAGIWRPQPGPSDLPGGPGLGETFKVKYSRLPDQLSGVEGEHDRLQAQNADASASVFGFGGPSDWEHFNSTEEQTPVLEISHSTEKRPHAQMPAELPAEHGNLATQRLEDASQPEPAFDHATALPVESQPAKASQDDRVASNAAPPPLQVHHRVASPESFTGPVHDDILSSDGSDGGMQRSRIIDGFIQAWNKPLHEQASWRTEETLPSRISSRHSSVSAISIPRLRGSSVDTMKTSPSQLYRVLRNQSSRATLAEIANGLEPEYQASLGRFVTMLRKESDADTDEEKFRIFSAFVEKETRLRTVLYGADAVNSEERGTSKPVAVSTPMTRVDADGPQVGYQAGEEARANLNEKPNKPSEPRKIEGASVPPQVGGATDPISKPSDGDEVTSSHVQHEYNSILAERKYPAPGSTTVPPLGSPSPKVRAANADDLGDVEDEYSPGGRPRLAAHRSAKVIIPKLASVSQEVESRSTNRKSQAPASPSENAPMVLEDYITSNPESPSINAPILLSSLDPSTTEAAQPQQVDQLADAQPKFEPARLVYTPFRYNESIKDVKSNPPVLQPAYQAYATLRHQSVDSGRTMAQATATSPGSKRRETMASPSSLRRDHEETFLDVIREQSMAHRRNTPVTQTTLVKKSDTPPNLLVRNFTTEAMQASQSILPQKWPRPHGNVPKLAAIQDQVEKIPDQFGFIRETVIRWDQENRQTREAQETARKSRQEESDSHVDALFRDNEIGYSEVRALDAEFKLSEASKKYEEDEQELQSFNTKVFETVTERLQAEIAQLNAQYVLAVDLLDLESDSASHHLLTITDRPRISQAMDTVLMIFNKLQVRYQKLAEAQFQRERRRMKLELSIHFANGDRSAVERLEQEFSAAQKLQVLHEARAKDTRANKLMDTFDRVTVRALGDNQRYIDDLTTKLQKLVSVVPDDNQKLSHMNIEPGELRSICRLAKEVLAFVVSDSKTMLEISKNADKMLNDADYGVSVEEARVAIADEATYHKLEADKAKEDDKLREDFEIRMGSITKGPEIAETIIEGLITKINTDTEHRDRMKRALEEAKARNASKEALVIAS